MAGKVTREKLQVDVIINGNEAQAELYKLEKRQRELNNSKLSLLKYIKNNSELDKNQENEVLFTFFQFVEGMLFFRSLDKNMYLGLETGSRGIAEDIIEKGNVKDLENFLNKAGIVCKLNIVKEIEKGQSFEINDINFATNSYELSAESKFVLDNFLNYLQANPSIKFKVVGHTDNVGNDSENRLLSANRAKVVKEYLIEKR